MMTDLSVLNERELQIAFQIADGKTAKQIACELGVPSSTVESRIETMLKKLKVRNRVQVAFLVGLYRRWEVE